MREVIELTFGEMLQHKGNHMRMERRVYCIKKRVSR